MIDPVSPPDAVTALQLALAEAARMTILALAPLLVGAVTAAAVQLFRKFGLDLDAQKQAKVEYYARLAIQEAEEWAARKLTQANIVITGSEKLSRAVESLVAKVPGVSQAEATALVHALLPEVGVGAAAALGKVVTAATTGDR